MWATKQTFHYNWCWKQVASVKALGHFHKNTVLLYWSHKERLFSLQLYKSSPGRDSLSCSRTRQEWFMPTWVEPRHLAAPMGVIKNNSQCRCKFAENNTVSSYVKHEWPQTHCKSPKYMCCASCHFEKRFIFWSFFMFYLACYYNVYPKAF